MSELITVLSSGTLSALITGALIFLCKSWISDRLKGAIQHEYDQKLATYKSHLEADLEIHKSQLKKESDSEIEKLKSQLQITATERSIKLTKVFENQAEVVVKTYQFLVELKIAVDLSVGFYRKEGSEISKGYEKNLDNKRNEFYRYFTVNKIYILEETAQKIFDFAQKLYSVKIQYTVYMDTPSQHRPKSSDLNATMDTLNNEIPKLLKLLETDFQKILGFSIQEKAP